MTGRKVRHVYEVMIEKRAPFLAEYRFRKKTGTLCGWRIAE